ncbi:hypothetical protein [Paenibacillus xerothermodurans]|uniref:Uncharacterized protein n=1 Tax=Paenibacillus xerothermodurans TaxID=1977292 RepID=A0A2W1NDD7_PAEXE|nr:hypothetical protein [Paenibacillus xerothermodurans]PZE21630.1 hypothetical protein CBW46_004185 [Paenibacillus xerothermodurans]
MQKLKAFVASVLFGAVVSVVSSFLFLLFAQNWAAGISSLWGGGWLYVATFIPFVMAFPMVGHYLANTARVTNRTMWLASFISAFLVTLVSGAVGAIFAEYIIRGSLDTVNMEGTLLWGGIYAAVLLPITGVFARVILHIYATFLVKIGVVPKGIIPGS